MREMENLSATLLALSLDCDVEARGKLAIVSPRDEAAVESLRSAALRVQVVTAARSDGFTHAAVELIARDRLPEAD